MVSRGGGGEREGVSEGVREEGSGRASGSVGVRELEVLAL